ncbi:HAD family hydrolase [Bacillus sp. RC51]|uniref:HAD family hydrolase n=1 Tax=Bacillus TaxID=1386 RepID=UPI00383400FC
MQRAVIFDFDGIIFDTEKHEYKSFKELYKCFDEEFPKDLWLNNIGSRHKTNPYMFLEKKLGYNVNIKELHRERKKLFYSLLSDEKPREGVKDLLISLKASNVKIGLASNSDIDWVLSFLMYLKLLDFFDIINTANDVTNFKPNPEVYIKTLSELNVSASNTIAFEDTPIGLESAYRAGLNCIVIPTKLTKNLLFNHAHVKFDSFLEFNKENYFERVYI